MAGTSLLDHFSGLEDPRQAGKMGDPLPEILLVVLCGTIEARPDATIVNDGSLPQACRDFLDLVTGGQVETAERSSA